MLNVLRRVLFVSVSLFAVHSQVAFSDCVHNSIVLKAARDGNLQLMTVYAEMPDFEINKICDKNKDNLSLLHVAAGAGQVDVVEYLLKIGFDVDDRNNDEKVTPLHYAILSRDAGTCAMLFKNGARIDSIHPEIKRLYSVYKKEVERERKILEEDGFIKATGL